MSDAVIDVSTAPAPGQAVGQKDVSGPLFNRYWDLTVGTASGETIQLAPFHVQFDVDMIATQTPWMMEATIINVPPELANTIVSRYTTVALAGGYWNVRQGILFAGQITYFEYGKLSPTETFLRIHAATMDTALSQAMINYNLPAGHTLSDVIKACIQTMPGISPAHISPMPPNQNPRGRLLFGMPRDVLRDVAQTVNAQVWIDGNNQLWVVTQDDTTYSPPLIDINMSNGMVNTPEQQLGNGLKVSCLLNYHIVPGALIRLNQYQINQVLAAAGDNPLLNQQWGLTTTAPINAGIFQAWSVRHIGDSRGGPWYTEITTRPVNPDQMAPSLAA